VTDGSSLRPRLRDLSGGRKRIGGLARKTGAVVKGER
jgi:hypothetical protein